MNKTIENIEFPNSDFGDKELFETLIKQYNDIKKRFPEVKDIKFYYSWECEGAAFIFSRMETDEEVLYREKEEKRKKESAIRSIKESMKNSGVTVEELIETTNTLNDIENILSKIRN